MKMRVLGVVCVTIWTFLVQEVSGFYNPSPGRWLSRDPIGERGGLNLYSFTLNRPLALVDRLGREVLCYYTVDGVPTCRSPLHCVRCICKFVRYEWDPNKGLQWYGNKFGGEINITWTVEGNPERCKYAHRETGLVIATPLDQKNKATKDIDLDKGWVPLNISKFTFSYNTASYVDHPGKNFTSPDDDGQWTVGFELVQYYKCTSTDGTSIEDRSQAIQANATASWP